MGGKNLDLGPDLNDLSEDDGEDSYIDSYAECMLIHYEVYFLKEAQNFGTPQ